MIFYWVFSGSVYYMFSGNDVFTGCIVVMMFDWVFSYAAIRSDMFCFQHWQHPPINSSNTEHWSGSCSVCGGL